MCPTIRIDDDVYDWLQGQAVPFDDTPNTVLRRVAGIESTKAKDRLLKRSERAVAAQHSASYENGKPARRTPLASGEQLIKQWKMPVCQARFHRDGHYYEHLTRFPAALCDPKGYIIFETEDDYRNCQSLQLGQQVNVKQPGISSIPGYQTVSVPLS